MKEGQNASRESRRVHLPPAVGESLDCSAALVKDDEHSKRGLAQQIYSLATSHEHHHLAFGYEEENKAVAVPGLTRADSLATSSKNHS